MPGRSLSFSSSAVLTHESTPSVRVPPHRFTDSTSLTHAPKSLSLPAMGRNAPGVQNRKPLAQPLKRGTLSQTPAQLPGPTGLAQAVTPPSPASLGQQILHFARSNIGRKVGDGECFALADRALRGAGAATAEDFCRIGRDTDYVWSSQEVNFNDAQPGDILQFRNFGVRRDIQRPDGSSAWQNESRPHHTAVVASTRTDGNIVFLTILEQNVAMGGTGNQPKKSVRQNEIPTSSGQLQSGRDKITYTVTGDLWIYRPVARSP